jgi:cytochrome c-type biogenesis protein CcmH/NrfF
MSPHLVLWLLSVGILLGVGMLVGRFIRRRQREHMQRLKAELTGRHREKLG